MLTVWRTLLPLCAVVLAGAPLPAQRRSSIIALEEIERVQPSVGTAYDAVQRLRPRWLRSGEVLTLPRSGQDARIAQVHVYLDDVDVGGLDYLKTIPAERLLQLRWLSTTEAGSRFGLTEGSAIVVMLKPAGYR